MLDGTPMLRIVLALVLLAPAACANRAKHSVSLYESGDYAGAMRAADEGLARHPDDDALWAMKVRAALALGDGAGVAKAYEDYVARRGDDDRELLRDLATATLAQALASPSAKLKMAAIEAVAQAEIHALTDQVAERMGDDDDRVAAAAAVAVLKGIPGAPQVADDLLRSDNADARRIVVDGIGRKVGKLALSDLQRAANDSDPRVRRAAIRWLGQLQDKDAVEILTKRLRDPDEAVRAASAVALAQIGVGNLEALGTQALSDRALAVRLGGVELMAAARRDDLLIALVDDADPMVALHAAIAVKAARPELAPKAIDRALAADEWTVRAGAANMLVMALGKAAALPAAQRMTSDRDAGVRLAAARVIAQYGDRQAARTIFTAALTDDRHGVQAAADLARLGDATGIKALGAHARDAARSPEHRAAAIAAHRSAHRVTPGLVGALADDNGLVRVAAAAVLGLLAKTRG
jgi:HEAT repeat protein